MEMPAQFWVEINIDVINDMSISGWLAVKCHADNPMDGHATQIHVAGRQPLPPKRPLVIKWSGLLPFLGQAMRGTIVTDTITLAPVFDLHLALKDVDKLVSLTVAGRRR